MKTVARAMSAAVVLSSVVAMHAAVKTEDWGKTPDGAAVHLYTLSNADITVKLSDYGARVVSVVTPDKSGNKADIVLGFNDSAPYVNKKDPYFGPVVGRFGNRINKGTFTLDGKTYHVPVNDGPNALHGGKLGFDRKVWTAKTLPSGVEFTLVSPDGDMGFPGTLRAHITYTLLGKSLRLQYSATTTKPTVVNLTNHSYWNLAGEGNGTILDELMMIPADRYTPIDATSIPTGQLPSVAGTPFDFRKPTAIGAHIGENNEQLQHGQGYDHNWVLNGKIGVMHTAAVVADPKSGRTLTITTTEPGLQFYSGNFLTGSLTGKSGKPYLLHSAIVLETQHFPDSPNQPSFPSTVLQPGQTLHSTTVLAFGVSK